MTRSRKMRRVRKTQRRQQKQQGGAYQCGTVMCEDHEVCGKDSLGKDKCSTRNNSVRAGKTGPAHNATPGAPRKHH